MTGRLPCASNHTKDAPSVVTKASKFSKSSRILQIPNILLDANSKIFSSNASPLHIRHLVTSLSNFLLHPRTTPIHFLFLKSLHPMPKKYFTTLTVSHHSSFLKSFHTMLHHFTSHPSPRHLFINFFFAPSHFRCPKNISPPSPPSPLCPYHFTVTSHPSPRHLFINFVFAPSHTPIHFLFLKSLHPMPKKYFR